MRRAAVRRQWRGLAVALSLALMGLVVGLAAPTPALALTCAAIGGVAAGDDCTLSTVFSCAGNETVTIAGSLTVTAGGAISCSAANGSGAAGADLTLNVGGNLVIEFKGALSSNGGSGGVGSPLGAGGRAGKLTVNVGGDMTLAGLMQASGGDGATGSSVAPSGGSGGTGGALLLSIAGSFAQTTGGLFVGGGNGGNGNATGDLGPGVSGGAGGLGGRGGIVNILANGLTLRGQTLASGGRGGNGGTAGAGGTGGGNGSGGAGGPITLHSGGDLVVGSTAIVRTNGGQEGNVGSGTPPGPNVGVGGLGGAIQGVRCASKELIVEDGSVVSAAGGLFGGGNGAFNLHGTSADLCPAGTCPTTFTVDFSDQYEACFRDVLRDGDINAGPDVSAKKYDSLRFTGAASSAGSTWLTVYDGTPTTPEGAPTFGEEMLCADVIFARFNNVKGAGLVALLSEGTGKTGLALVVSNAGNTDHLRLMTLDGDPKKLGKLTPLETASLRGGILEHVWYRLVLTVDPAATPKVTGKIYAHADPHDPNSALAGQVGPTVTSDQLPSATGENGILAQATSAVVDLSVTNFSNNPAFCVPGG